MTREGVERATKQPDTRAPWREILANHDVLVEVLMEAVRLIRITAHYVESGFLVDPDDQRDIDAFLALFPAEEEAQS